MNTDTDKDKNLEDLQLYSLRKVRELTGVTRRTLVSYITSGRLKANKIGGRWTVSLSNLKKFINGE